MPPDINKKLCTNTMQGKQPMHPDCADLVRANLCIPLNNLALIFCYTPKSCKKTGVVKNE
jgi:hypothetical protein